MLKKPILLILALVFIAGCVNNTPKQSVQKEINVWYWMVDRRDAFEELAKNYEKETGVKVNFKLFSPDVYSQKVIAAARAGTLPEVFGILGEKKILASFVKAGYVLDLTPYMQESDNCWKNRFYPQVLEQNTFDKDNVYDVVKGIYGVPIDMMNIQFLYNKDVFVQAGLDPEMPPLTFDDFIKYNKIIAEKTKTKGFACGWGEVWLINCVFTEWAMNNMGEKDFLKTLKGDIKYTDPRWIEVFELFKKLRDEQVLIPNIESTINKEAEQYFSQNKVAFSFDGSWCINIYSELNPQLNYGVFPIPAVSNKYPVKIWGGAGSSFMISANSSLKEETVRFLNWLTETQQQKYLIKETHNLPSIKGCEEVFSDQMKEFSDDTDKITHPNVWPYEEDPMVTEALNEGLQQIVMGLKTPQQVAQDVQEVKDRVMKRQ